MNTKLATLITGLVIGISTLSFGFGEKVISTQYVELETSSGKIVVEVDHENAPISAKNFVSYVKDGYYDNTIFHRVIPNFMIQGGGFEAGMKLKVSNDPIINEATNGLKNTRGSIAMARTSEINSATSQFFINHRTNEFLDHKGTAPRTFGYAVFGKVVDGMDIVDKIAAVSTAKVGYHANVPQDDVMIKQARLLSNYTAAK